jgi:hypothetical protein
MYVRTGTTNIHHILLNKYDLYMLGRLLGAPHTAWSLRAELTLAWPNEPAWSRARVSARLQRLRRAVLVQASRAGTWSLIRNQTC